jgi:hypothetical protein
MLVKREYNTTMVEMLQIPNLSSGKLRFPRVEALQVPVHSQDSAPRYQSQVLLGYQFGTKWQVVRESIVCVLGLDRERARKINASLALNKITYLTSMFWPRNKRLQST